MKPTRRDFLVAGAGVAATAADGARGALIIDTHVHFYDPARPQGVPWPAKNDTLLYRSILPADYKAESRWSGVERVVVVEASPWLEDNQWILDLAQDEPLIVGFVGHLNPGMDGFRENLARFSKNSLFRGIRVAGADIAKGVSQESFMDDLRRLGDADLSMDALGDSAMIAPLITIAGRIPNLRLVIDHMPVEPSGWKPEAMRELAAHPQVYAKVSTVLKRVDGSVSVNPADYKASLDEVWDVFGTDRVMYGSNWPVSGNLASYRGVLLTVMQYVQARSANDTYRYFLRNSKDCYKWTDRG